ncbi:hypothetical protein [Paraconexibacter sp.]|uniref:cupredoxin domain-containing protein n=1 Tax=Paraconexibacter sp. TaxID=2949640 RepID=UPI00356AC73D
MPTMQRTTRTGLALLATTGLALTAPALAATPKPKTYTIMMSAEEYVPHGAATKRVTKKDSNRDPVVTIRSGDSLKLVWPEIGDTHDMAYAKGGKIVWQTDNFASTAKITIGPKSKNRDINGKSLKKVISKPGTYKLYCTFHSGTMKLKLIVKKASKK